jgi:hypothetical protein
MKVASMASKNWHSMAIILLLMAATGGLQSEFDLLAIVLVVALFVASEMSAFS